nr:hypothetical protein GCM10020092_018910 [Actinoplanes digitatis]
MGYRALIAAAVCAHFAFLAFGIFGGFLAWRLPRLIWLQAICAGWLLVIVVAGLTCPLTWLEDRGREGADSRRSTAGSWTATPRASSTRTATSGRPRSWSP